jgi:hypothetical protein
MICLLSLILQVNTMIGFQIKSVLYLLFPIILIYMMIDLDKYSYSCLNISVSHKNMLEKTHIRVDSYEKPD